MGERGERGPTGDHGQDGRVGPQGERGRDVDPATVRHERAKIDRRLLILYGLLVVLLAAFLFYVKESDAKIEESRAKFETAIVENCEIGLKNTTAFNDLLDRLVEAVKVNPNYSVAERAKAIKFYESGRQTLPECPPAKVKE